MDETPVDYCRPPLGVLAVRGPDARRFLQGQLSADVIALAPGEARWAGLHNPQGRTLATLRLIADRTTVDGTDVLALLPRERLAVALPLLQRYLLRAKATLGDESEHWELLGVFASPATVMARLTAASATAGAICVPADASASRCWLLRPRAIATPQWPAPTDRECAVAHWQRQDIAAGLPEVYAASAAAFVAQMLNLDLIGGIAFDKGCYTGQEVIARAHYRGRVKRRMQRFGSRSTQAADWPPAAQGLLPDGRRFEVVDSVDRPDGGCEWLAVTTFAVAATASRADDDVVASGSEPASAASALRRCSDAESLPLPYALPLER
jgi:tRNA-modifying protein YgfZ